MKNFRHPWTLEYLTSLPDEELDRIGKRVAAGLAVSKLRAGRVILAMQQTGLPKRLGYKNALHYFKLAGAHYVEARECLRVARGCEDLPLLRGAAEAGSIGWSQLREVVRVARPETEAGWLESCQRHTSKQVQAQVRGVREANRRAARQAQSAAGEASGTAVPSAGSSAGAPAGSPGEPVLCAAPAAQAGPVELRLKLTPEMQALVSRATRELSERAGRPLSASQVFECLLAHYFTGHAFAGELLWSRMLGTPVGGRKEKNSREFFETTPETPWEAVAATTEPCPGEPELELVRPAPAHWEGSELVRTEAFPCACPECPNHLWLEVHELANYSEGRVGVPEGLLVLCGECRSRVRLGALRVKRLTDGGLLWTDSQGRNILELAPAGQPDVDELWDLEDDEYDEELAASAERMSAEPRGGTWGPTSWSPGSPGAAGGGRPGEAAGGGSSGCP